MPRFNDYMPAGVIPATLLAFDDDFAIDEEATVTEAIAPPAELLQMDQAASSLAAIEGEIAKPEN